jgi:hypothetical protein
MVIEWTALTLMNTKFDHDVFFGPTSIVDLRSTTIG